MSARRKWAMLALAMLAAMALTFVAGALGAGPWVRFAVGYVGGVLAVALWRGWVDR